MTKRILLDLLICSSMFFVSCSSGISIINPPSWIIGTWSDSSDSYSYIFDSEDFYFIYTEDGETSQTTEDFKEELTDYSAVTFNETCSSNLYKYEVTYTEDSITHTIKETFSETDTDTLQCTKYYDGDIVSELSVEFTKQ